MSDSPSSSWIGPLVAAATVCLLGIATAAQGVFDAGPFSPEVPGAVTPHSAPCAQGSGLFFSDASLGDFGQLGSAALVDGGLLLAGAPGDDAFGEAAGIVRMFSAALGGPALGPLDELFPDDAGPLQRFGASLDCSGDVLVVGAPGSGDFDSVPGAAYVFERLAGAWVQTAKLEGAPGPEPTGFGLSVAADGDTLAIGAPFESTASAAKGGAVYVFERDAERGGWTQTARLIGAVPNGGILGASVDLEGDLLVAGAPYLAVEFISGSAFVFRRSGGEWSLLQKLTSGFPGRDRFGRAVALHGGEIFVGAPRDTPPSTGLVLRFRRVGAPPAPFERVKVMWAPDVTPFDGFGGSLAFDDQRLLVGAPNKDAGHGAVYLYDVSAPRVEFACKLPLPPGGEFAQFGGTLRLSGTRALVGAPGDDVFALDDGSLLLFEFGLPPQQH